jgi:hypothetical protein
LAKDATPGQVASTLNLAFFGAYVAAEQERAALPPAEQEGKCKAVADNGLQLLRSLELPTDPKAYTREGSQWLRGVQRNPFRKSAIAYRIKRTVDDVEPLPFPDLDDNWRNLEATEREERVSRALKAAEEVPLTEKMIPTSIAERILPIDLYPSLIHPLAHSLSESSKKGLRQIEAEVSVGVLLDMAPSAIALLISLAKLAEKRAANTRVQQAEPEHPDGEPEHPDDEPEYPDGEAEHPVRKPVGPRKPNYSRTFRRALFRLLARAYWSSFGAAPNISDNITEPAAAAEWVGHVLALAAHRRESIAPVKTSGRGPIPSLALADEAERQRLIKEIERVFRLKLSVKAKRLSEGWRSSSGYVPRRAKPK